MPCIAIRAWPQRCASAARIMPSSSRAITGRCWPARRPLSQRLMPAASLPPTSKAMPVTTGVNGAASVIAKPADAPAFPDLAAIGRIEAERHANGKLASTVHYVVLSKRLSPRRTLEVTRMHWSVENQLHWRLDVVFNEDDARTRKNYGPENLAVLRRIALDILRA